jgi:LCP family protein required for cell wall assembly
MDINQDTTKISVDINNQKGTKKSPGRRILYYFAVALMTVIILLLLGYLIFLRPMMTKPISAKLSDDLSPIKTQIAAYYEAEEEAEKEEILSQIEFPEHLEEPPIFLPAEEETDSGGNPPVCGMPRDMVFLLIGTDSKKDWTYSSGLADVIRLIRIDFVKKQINMIALPRDMIVEFPEGRTTMESPMKINQAYSLGTSGVQKYAGGGNGANSLAEAIDYNFGVKAEHYMVVNFQFVINIIDAVGGLNVYLPQAVEDDYFGYFPVGQQYLDGQSALDLMRIRMKYNDDFRVGNQTIVLKSMFARMKNPDMFLKIPTLVRQFKDHVLTDLSAEELINLGNCVLKEFSTEDINAKQFTREHIQGGRELIPSMNLYLFVYKWGDEAVKFIHDTLKGE